MKLWEKIKNATIREKIGIIVLFPLYFWVILLKWLVEWIFDSASVIMKD
jgi:uncharacterized membrane protein